MRRGYEIEVSPNDQLICLSALLLKDSEAVDLLIIEKMAGFDHEEEDADAEDVLDLDEETKEKLNKVVKTLCCNSLSLQ